MAIRKFISLILNIFYISVSYCVENKIDLKKYFDGHSYISYISKIFKNCDKNNPQGKIVFVRAERKDNNQFRYTFLNKEDIFKINFYVLIKNFKNKIDETSGNTFVSEIGKFILDNYLDKLLTAIDEINNNNKENPIFIISKEKLLENFNDENKFSLIMCKTEQTYGCLYQDLRTNKYAIEDTIRIQDFSTLPIIDCSNENLNKNFEDYEDYTKELMIFINLNLEEEFSSIKNYNETGLSNLITNKELADFMKKYMYEIYNGHFRNLIIKEENQEYTFKEEGEKIKVEYKVNIETKIEKQDNFYIVPIIYRTRDKINIDTKKEELKIPFSLNGEFLKDSLKKIIEETYGVKITDDIENYGFLLYDKMKYPYELLFGLKHFEEELIINNWEKDNKINDERGQSSSVRYDDEYINKLIKEVDAENKIINKGEYWKFYNINLVETLLKWTTNFFETKENNKNIKLQFKDIKTLCKFHDENNKNIYSADMILQKLKKLIDVLVKARQTITTKGRMNDIKTKNFKILPTSEESQKKFDYLFLNLIMQREINEEKETYGIKDFEKEHGYEKVSNINKENDMKPKIEKSKKKINSHMKKKIFKKEHDYEKVSNINKENDIKPKIETSKIKTNSHNEEKNKTGQTQHKYESTSIKTTNRCCCSCC